MVEENMVRHKLSMTLAIYETANMEIKIEVNSLKAQLSAASSGFDDDKVVVEVARVTVDFDDKIATELLDVAAHFDAKLIAELAAASTAVGVKHVAERAIGFAKFEEKCVQHRECENKLGAKINEVQIYRENTRRRGRSK